MLAAGCETRCRACQHRDLPASESESRKEGFLREKLADWGDVLSPIVGEPDLRWGYREKACLRAEWSGSHWKLGLRIPSLTAGSSPRRGRYEVLDLPGCPIHSERIRKWHTILATRLPGREELPLAFVVFSGALVTMVIKSPVASGGTIVRRLKSSGVLTALTAAGADGIFANFNPSAGDRVLSARGWVHLAGTERAERDGMVYGPDSFQQILPRLHSQALDEAVEFLSPRAGDIVLDLYSGSGASLRRWRSAGVPFIGVELSGEAVLCAERNAGGRDRALPCLRGRVSERIPQLAEWVARYRKPEGRVLVYANPPRLGLEPEVTEWLGEKVCPDRIAYLSCSAGTLARDLGGLTKAGYRVSRISPYDFFPQTHHVETLAVLERKT